MKKISSPQVHDDTRLGLDDALRRALLADTVPVPPAGEEGLLHRLRPVLQRRGKISPSARLFCCMRSELTALPVHYLCVSLLLAGLVVFLACRIQPKTLIPWMAFLPSFPVSAALAMLTSARSRCLSELAATFLFDFPQLLMARLLLCAAHILLLSAAVLVAAPFLAVQGALVFSSSLLLCGTVALFFLRFRWALFGAGAIPPVWGGCAMLLQHWGTRRAGCTAVSLTPLLAIAIASLLFFIGQLIHLRRSSLSTPALTVTSIIY